jgi:uncharacterized protein
VSRPSFTAVRGFDAASWESLGPRSVCTGTRWLQAMGSRLPGDPYTFLMDRAGDPALGAHGAVVSRPDAYEAFNLGEILVRVPPVFELDERVLAERVTLAAAAPVASWFPNLVIAVPGYESPVVGPAAGDAGALDAFVRQVLRWAREAGLRAAGFLYVPEASGALRAALAGSGGAPAPLTIRSGLDVTWGDLDGYLAVLPPHRRREVRRELRRLAERGVRTVPADPARHLDDLVRLRCLLLEKYGHAADRTAERARLDALSASFGPDLTAFVARRGGDVLGFSLMLRGGPSWHALLSGVDTAAGDARYVHFDTLFYAPAGHAPGMGIREISYGIGHAEGKAARGCRLSAVLGHVFGLTPDLERAVGPACAVLDRGFPYAAHDPDSSGGPHPSADPVPAPAGRA